MKKFITYNIKFFYYLFFKFLIALFKLNPLTKGSKIVIFGAMNGKYYGDNSKYMFEYFIEKRKDIKCYWITNNKELYLSLKINIPIVYSRSLKGALVLSKAKVGFFTNALTDLFFNYRLIPNTLELIALRHGRSVKRVRYARNSHKIDEKETIMRAKETSLIKYVISTSAFISKLQEECLLVGKDKHVITGYPRNDFLFNPSDEMYETWSKFNNSDYSGKKVILYAPSWRHGREATKFFPFEDFYFEKLNTFIAKNDITLLIRPHKNDLNYPELINFFGKLTKINGIRLCSHNEVSDVNSILPFIDILLTDYSALYHDYLLLDRPIIFIPYDYYDFNDKNGFLYNYFENLPGVSVNTFDELIFSIISSLESPNEYNDKRVALKNMIHQFQDDRSRERIFQLALTIIEDNS